jgi:hypothetical protein
MNWVLMYYVGELSNLAKPGYILRKIRSIEEKNTTVCVFQNVNVPVCSATRNIPLGNTAHYAANKLRVNITFQSKT